MLPSNAKLSKFFFISRSERSLFISEYYHRLRPPSQWLRSTIICHKYLSLAEAVPVVIWQNFVSVTRSGKFYGSGNFLKLLVFYALVFLKFEYVLSISSFCLSHLRILLIGFGSKSMTDIIILKD